MLFMMCSFAYINLMNLFLLSSGAKHIDFIILREVPMNVVDLDMDVAPPPAAAAPMMLPPPPTLPTSPSRTP